MRLLGVSLPGEGHLNPLLPILRGAAAAGHDVAVATAASYLDDVRAAGLEGVPAGPDYRFDRWPDIWPELVDVPPEAQELWWLRTLSRDVTPGLAGSLVHVVRDRRVELLLAEYAAAPAAGIAAELTGVPVVAAAWAVEPGYGVHDGEVTGIDGARRQFGLPPLAGGPLAPMAAVLSFLPPSWGAVDGPAQPRTWRVRIPPVGHQEATPAYLTPQARPRVYATLGTVYGSVRLLRAIISGIGSGGWAGVVTVSRRLDATRFVAPEHVVVEQYVPQGAVLPQCDAVLCHGGLGTILGALDAGLPLVIVPLGSDQLQNASRAERLGVARVIPPQQVTPATVEAALRDVLEDPRCRSVAAALQRELATMPTVEATVLSLQRLLDEPS